MRTGFRQPAPSPPSVHQADEPAVQGAEVRQWELTEDGACRFQGVVVDGAPLELTRTTFSVSTS